MPKSSLRFRLAVLAVLLLAAGATAAMVRWAALPWALGEALKAGGATEVSFDVARVSPWRLQLEDLTFALPATRVAAGSVSLERRHWWSPSLGRLKVRAARVDVDLERLAVIERESGGGTAPSAAVPVLPLEGISVDGQVTVHTGSDPARALRVSFAAQPEPDGSWKGDAHLQAPGLTLALEGGYAPATQAGGFRTTELEVDVQAWQAWLENWAPLPLGPWEVSGRVTGRVKADYQNGNFSSEGEFHVREGRLAHSGFGVTAEGVEMDVASVDLIQPRAQGLSVRAGNVTSGKIVLTDVRAEAATATLESVEVTSLVAFALGGRVQVEPFVYRLADPAVEAVVRAESIRAEQVLALTQDLPAHATGPLSGRLPLRYEAGSLRLGTGWLGLVSGTSLEVQLQAEGLLTGGMSPQSRNYAVLKRIEDGLLKLKVSELRLDIRPPGAPASRSAQLRIVGAPLDPQVKAPVTLDLNVNGPIEGLLNLGLKTGMNGGTKP